MNENRDSLQYSNLNYEDDGSTKIKEKLILDDNIRRIIDKYKTCSFNKKSREHNKNDVIELKKSTEDGRRLEIKNKESSGRQNDLLYNLPYENSCNRSNNNEPQLVLHKKTKERSDKTTYCRPVADCQLQFPKIVEKNGRLRGTDIFWRRKEVEESVWNRYIRFLKKKHLSVPEKRQSFSCIQDMIGSKPRKKYCLEKRDRIEDMNKNKISVDDFKIYQPLKQSPCKILYVTRCRWKPYLIEKDCSANKSCSTEVKSDKIFTFTKQVDTKHERTFKNCVTQVSSVQTTLANTFHPKNFRHDKSPRSNMESNTTVTQNKIKKEEKTIIKSVETIEYRLDTLLQTLNDFMNEIRFQRTEKDVTKSSELETNKSHYDEIQISRNNSVDLDLKKNVVNYTRPPSNISQSKLKVDKFVSNDIFVNTYQADFDKLHKRSSVQTKFQVPTRDVCTKISNSLSHQIPNCSFQITPDFQHTETTTTAFNTDPLSLVALLKISAEALREFFSFNFQSYISCLQIPRLQWREPRLCLCADNDNMQNTTEGNFNPETPLRTFAPFCPYKCEYCDQIFDKACSWELHVFSCARSLRRFHKITNEK